MTNDDPQTGRNLVSNVELKSFFRSRDRKIPPTSNPFGEPHLVKELPNLRSPNFSHRRCYRLHLARSLAS
ncbi:MAG: hypothetical protein RID53_04450 [Coleofasciculus sp. B1-GNL1-01]|uniref:hypothetical protein n=1 Tax=Coleofasciculus sp. B1-GNL1-01 TaxID=3068484 RepID=UPI0032F1B05D